jgi:putative aldouronate transport system permease protein
MGQGVKLNGVKGNPGKVRVGVLLRKDFTKNRGLYLLFLPVLIYYLIFQYGPMFGIIIAFKNYTPSRGFINSPWVGLKHFVDFTQDYYFLRVLRNTIRISVSSLVFAFPIPIVLALLINALKNKYYARIIQTVTYLPHFISVVVIAGIIVQLTSRTGSLTQFLSLFGFPRVTILNEAGMFVPLYVISGIWQGAGWSSIIYLSALTAIDSELYEAAMIDGAGKFRQLISITLPGISETIVIMLILQIGRMFSVGSEKILLLYNPLTYETADVISTYVYRKGLLEFSWSYSAAVGMFNSVVNFTLVVLTNKLSHKLRGSGLW